MIGNDINQIYEDDFEDSVSPEEHRRIEQIYKKEQIELNQLDEEFALWVKTNKPTGILTPEISHKWDQAITKKRRF